MPTLEDTIKLLEQNIEGSEKKVVLSADDAKDILWFLTGFRDGKPKPYWK